MALIDRRPGIRLRSTIGGQLDVAARVSFPACVTVLLMLLTDAPFDLPGQAALLPSVAVVCVWFWSLAQPAYLPPPVVFLIGLLLDLLGYLPLGVGVLTLLTAYGVAQPLRRHLAQRGFALIWLTFVPIAAGTALLIWAAVMLLTFTLLSPGPALFEAALTIAMYPALAVPFSAAQRSITSVDGA